MTSAAEPPPYPKAPATGYFDPAQSPSSQPPPAAPGVQVVYPPQGHVNYGMQPVVPVQTTTIVAPVIQRLGHHSSPAQCPSCKQQVTTVVEYRVGSMTWVACIILCFLGLDCGCCFIPFCVDAAKTAVHHCPNCQGIIGEHNPF